MDTKPRLRGRAAPPSRRPPRAVGTHSRCRLPPVPAWRACILAVGRPYLGFLLMPLNNGEIALHRNEIQMELKRPGVAHVEEGGTASRAALSLLPSGPCSGVSGAFHGWTSPLALAGDRRPDRGRLAIHTGPSHN